MVLGAKSWPSTFSGLQHPEIPTWRAIKGNSKLLKPQDVDRSTSDMPRYAKFK
jgi:hypothetical protein